MPLTHEPTPIRATAYEYTLSYVRSLPPNSDASQTAAVDAIAAALRLPSLFNFDAVFRLDAVIAAQNHELFSLLRVFINDGLSEFQAWATAHTDSFAKYSKYKPLKTNDLESNCDFGRSRPGAAGAQNPPASSYYPRLPKYRARATLLYDSIHCPD